MKIRAWITAVERASSNQPTAAEVGDVVFEILHPAGEDQSEKPQTRSELRRDVASRLRTAIARRKSWDQVEKLLEDLEELL